MVYVLCSPRGTQVGSTPLASSPHYALANLPDYSLVFSTKQFQPRSFKAPVTRLIGRSPLVLTRCRAAGSRLPHVSAQVDRLLSVTGSSLAFIRCPFTPQRPLLSISLIPGLPQNILHLGRTCINRTGCWATGRLETDIYVPLPGCTG